KRIMKGEFEKEAKDQVGTQQSKSENGKDVLLMTNQELYEYSEKAKFEATEKAKKMFGFTFFNSDKLSFEPSVNIPITKDYVLGVNDELTINITGASQQVYDLTIDRSGVINIPEAGSIYLQGVTFEEAKRLIKHRLISIYSGMAGVYPNTWADVSITNVRAIKVNVIGEVMVPGTYSLPATASAFNALYLSGGPNENGSFRNIRVIRDNKVIKIVDVYDYLINADGNSNIPLRDQDIILVPAYENRVEMAGSFKRTGYFEVKKSETMDNLLKYAGGFTGEAYKGALSVTRITKTQRMMVDVFDREYDSFKPVNGDSIFAGVVQDKFENRIIITGAVNRPGTYALDKGMKLSDLIQKAQGVTEDVFNNRGLIFRKGKDLTPSTTAFDISEVLKQTNDIDLQREDSVVIQDIFSMREKRVVKIFGEVQKSGEFPYFEGMTISDLIFQAGGLREAASESFIEISRRHSHEKAASRNSDLVDLFQFNIHRDLKLAKENERFELAPFDYVYIRKAPSYFEQKTVTIEGEVQYPGQYSIRSKNERVSDVLKRAGGLTPHAYINGATLYRSVEKELQKDTAMMKNLAVDTIVEKAARQLASGRVELQLDKILKDTMSVYNYHLKEGDRIVIPEVSEAVNVVGAILNPVGLAYEKGKKANYYIDRSGGFSDKANTHKVYVVNSDGTTRVTRSFIFTKYPPVQPGSKIIVPEKAEKAQVSVSTWLAIASTFSSLAIAIAAIMP
ncbi:MAG: SLBB domain-containing protein, partial [Bacteroidota bacterium]|nr:SLBB domain-containing protein [Bacteroidota bacterium]